MCQHRSYIVLESGKVLSLEKDDSHEKIREAFNVRDTNLEAGRQTSLEMLPVDLTDCSTWKLHFDSTKHDWWTDNHEKAVREQLRRDHAKYWHKKNGVYVFGGNLDLRSLTSLPANAKLSAGGDLDLSSLTSLPANERTVKLARLIELGLLNPRTKSK